MGRVVSVVALMAACLPVVGCVDGEPSSIIIVGQQTLDEECIAQSDPLRSVGTLDTTVRTNYIMHLAVWNQLRARAGHVGAEPNGFHVESAVASVEAAAVEEGQDELLVPPRRLIASGYIPPSEDGVTPGEGTAVVSVDLGLPENESLPRGMVHLRLQLEGKTNGQHTLRTGEWVHVVELCQGCLACDPGEEGGNCLQGQDSACYPVPN
jgi:hypothetical protein